MDSFQSQRPGRGQNLPNNEEEAFIQATFDLLDEAEKEFKLDSDHKNVILVFSDSRKGVSTFTQWMAGDNTNLTANVKKDTGEYKIEDRNNTTNSEDRTEATLPHLIADAKENIAYYEFPALTATESNAGDLIATTYFTKKVLDHAENIKIVLSITQRSVMKGEDKRDFLQLINHVTGVVKDIEKFRNSIAMVVTGVDSPHVKQESNSFLDDDTDIKRIIADFLREVKQFCEENLKIPDISEKDRKYYASAKTFVDVILEKNDEYYPKIGVLRRQAKPRYDGDNSLEEGRERELERMLNRNLEYARKNQGDFCYTVPDEYKNETADLIKEIKNNISVFFNDVSHHILKYYTDLTERLRREIKYFTENIFIDDSNLSASKRYPTEFNNFFNILTDLIDEMKNSNDTENLTIKVNDAVDRLNINISNESIKNIVKQGKYLKFLLSATDSESKSRPWEDLFKSTLTHLVESKETVRGEIEEEAEKLNFRIVSNLNKIVEAFQEHYTSKMKVSDIQQLPGQLETGYNVVTKMMGVIGNSTGTEELVRTIHDYANTLDIIVPKEYMIDILSQGKYLEFLKNVREGNTVLESSAWANPFEAVSENLHQSQRWYTFLNALYEKFSEYEVQKNRHTYNVANIDDWGKANKPGEIKITNTSYNEFLNKVATFNVTGQDNVKNVTLTDLQLEELNHVLNLTLKHKISAKCEDSFLIVSGSFFGNGDTVDDDNKPDDSCIISLFGGKVYPSLFGLNVVYIDSSSNQLPFPVLISPKWEVIGQKTLDVSGREGESQMTPFSFFKPRTRSKAANGTRPGARGDDGKPGGPGGPGYFFLGIGDTFVNGENLTIKASGGDGGSGEHGGDGYSANKALSAVSPSNRDRCQKDCKEIYGFKCQTLSYDFKPGHCSGTGKQKVCTPDEYNCKYKIFGYTRSGEKWKSDGGNGGRGGKGGPAGNIKLFELSGDSKVMTVSEKGKDGLNGDGGAAGSVGGNGDDIIVSFDSKASLEWKVEKRISHGGKMGIDGGNAVGLLNPKPPIVLKDPFKIVNKYKSYLRENLMDRFTRTRRLQFLEKINSNDEINSIYDTTGFIDEFEELEKQYHILNKDIDFVPFYQSLLPRISEYSKNPKDYEKSSQYKKVLNFLYTAILGKINNVKEDSESNLIVNIGGYLDIVKGEIEALRDLQKVNNKAEIISKYQERYKDNLDRKIDEAKNIVEKLITPEMEKIRKAMDNKIDLLINETIELEKKAEKEKDALLKKKQELERAMAWRGLFSCISIFSTVLSFFGPIGAVVGTAIGTTSSVVESLVLDNQQQDVQIPPDVVGNIKILGDQLKSVREKKVSHLEKLLEETSQEISKNPHKLGDMTGKIADLKTRLNKAKENKYDFKEIKKVESELKVELKSKEGQLKISVPDEKTKGALKVVEKLSQVAQLGTLLVDIYNKHKNDQEKVDAITDAIEKTEDKIQKLKLYEEQIYEIITPTLRSMENNLEDVASKLEAKSQISLEVTKWKVQSALRDMKLQMQQLTEGFQVKDNLARCIEKMEEVMTTLINVYDRIQNYRDQQNLANYIADISSASASSINISDPNLVKAMNHLEMLIRSNVVLTQYKAAINAFKQWVFPFANYYLEKSMLPSHLELENNIENLVEVAVKQVGSIKSKLDLYKTSVKKTDKYINTGEFSSRYVSTEPFYVWKNDEFKETISKLLSGEEVVLRADVKKSAADKDAIKFSTMELYFKTNNETLQMQMNDVLKGFDIMATHLGNSYYRYADTVYVITSDIQTIWYSCEKNVVGEPVRKNIVFDKIKDGDLMLSPYTLWELKIINSTRRISYRDLDIYKDFVDIELSGYGSYVRRNVNGFKFAAKEYRSMGRFDEVDACIESVAKNSSECTDLIGRMTRSAHHVEGLDGYRTNGAAPRLWSPLNYACNFLKLYIVSNFLQVFVDEEKNFNSNVSRDTVVTPSSNEGSFKEEKVRSAFNDVDRAKLVKNEFIKDDENRKLNCIDHGFNFKDYSQFRKPFLPNETKGKDSWLGQCPEVNCTLLLADLVTRKMTGNKYRQATEECLLSPQEKLQIRLDDCAIRGEEDAKRHLHILSRMTEDRENSWLNGAKSYAKSIFQYFRLDKNSGPDEIVEDVRILFP